MHTVLVLGGYGFFGGRICEALSRMADIRLFIAGRDLLKAQSAARMLGLTDDRGIAIDANGPDLAEQLSQLHIDTLRDRFRAKTIASLVLP